MKALLVLAAFWATCSAATIALLWRESSQPADDEPEPEPEPSHDPSHDPRTCGACLAADDAVMERFDLTLWNIECGEAL